MATWIPTDLGAKLLCWLTVDDAASISLSGSDVASWTDQVGPYVFSEATNRPSYSATGGPASTPCIIADGVAEFLELASVPFPTGTADSEMWACVSQDALAADTSQRSILHYGGAGGANTRGIGRRVTSGTNRFKTSSGTNEVATTAADFSGWHAVRGRWTGTGTTTTAQIDELTASTGAVAVNSGTDRTRVFANSSGAIGQFWNGKATDLIVTTATLTGGEETLLWEYLINRAAGILPDAGTDVDVTEVNATGTLGTVMVAAEAAVSLTNVSATGAVGDVTTDTSLNADVTEIHATGAIGDVVVAGMAQTEVTSVSATGELGDVTVESGAVTVLLTSVTASAVLGSVLVWGPVPIGPTGNWVDVPAGPGGGWSQVPTGPTGNWSPVTTS